MFSYNIICKIHTVATHDNLFFMIFADILVDDYRSTKFLISHHPSLLQTICTYVHMYVHTYVVLLGAHLLYNIHNNHDNYSTYVISFTIIVSKR